MNVNSRFYQLVAALVLVAMSFGESRSLQAQTGTPIDTGYTGAYRLAGTDGQIKLGYQVRRKDTILMGDFRFEGYRAESLLGGTDKPLLVKGAFNLDQPVGPWRLVQGNYSPSGKTDFDELRYNVTVDGKRLQLAGDFQNGRPHGTWTALSQGIRNSELVDTSFASTLTFNEGVPQQTLRMVSGQSELIGLLTREGIADGTWTLLDPVGNTEDWTFNEGRLVKIVSTTPEGEATTTELPADGPDAAPITVPLDEAYLKFLRLSQQLSTGDAPAIRGQMAQVLNTNAAHYRPLNEVLAQLADSEPITLAQVVVSQYPLSAQEQEALLALKSNLDRFDSGVDAITNDRTLRIVADTDPEAAYLLAVLGELQGLFLRAARSVDTAARADVVRLLPRAAYLASLWPDEMVDGEVQVSYDSPEGTQTKSFAGPGPAQFNIAAKGLGAVAEMSAYALRSLEEIRRELAGKLTTDDRNLVLAAQSTRLERAFGRIDSLVASQERRVARNYRLNDVRAAAELQLADFRALDQLAQQQQLDEVTACMDELYALAANLQNLPVRSARIEDAYTDEIWNNIIATVMEERVKKRITKAYSEKLIPYFLDEVGSSLDCNRAGEIVTQLDQLHARMLQLRDEETSGLEDRLRETDDPQAILALLKVTPLN